MAVTTTARLRYVSIPPRKMRVVAQLVQGMPIQKALDALNFMPRVAAHHVAKTLKSAAANALSLEGTAHLKPEDLMVKSIYVDDAPMAKRIRFQSMGRVFRYRKRYCHLTVILAERPHPKPALAAGDKTKAVAKAGEGVAGAKAEKTSSAKPAKKKVAAKAKTPAKKTVKKTAKK
ncbi:MAG: 50S ribosomal protein L22 [Candidatus Zixiibacteriota bacterium]